MSLFANKTRKHQRLKKELRLRNELLIVGIISFLQAGCASFKTRSFDKPNITMCILHTPANEGICGTPGGDLRPVPLSELDKSIAFSPANWERVQNYIDFLELFAKECTTSEQGGIDAP